MLWLNEQGKMATESAFGFDQADDSPGFLLWQTTVTWQRLIKSALEPYNISHTHHVIMAILLWFEEHHYEATQVLISKWSKLDKMTVSNSLKKLGELGYISRVEHETDTRAKRVKLTKNGKSLARSLVPIVEKIDAKFFGKLKRRDEKELIRLLGSLMKESKHGKA
jgi:DNA-binding MarR family transcriptional regulator